MLEDLLADIFNEFLIPVLMMAFDFVWDLVYGMIIAFLGDLFFSLWTTLLKVLLILEKIFDVFSCTTGVYVQNAAGQMVETSVKVNGYVDVTKSRSLLDVLIRSDPVVNAVFGMTMGAFVLCFIVTIFAVIRSMGEGIGELKRPVSHVLRQTAKACVTFALIPIVCIFMVKLAGSVIAVTQMNLPENIEGKMERDAMDLASEALSNNTGKPRRGSKQSSIEKAIAAVRTQTSNAETRTCDLIYFLIVKDALRNPANQQYYMSGQHFQNSTVAKEDVDLASINWLYAFFETLLVIIIFLKLIIECMARIFMILILFVVSPYFVAMIPLDDGAKFKRWKEMFVGFSISVFGPIIAMKTYMVLLPYVVTNSTLNLGFKTDNFSEAKALMDNTMNSALGLSTNSLPAVGMTEQIFRLFFIAAGGYAVYKSQHLMLDLINPEVSKFLSAASAPVDKAVKSGLSAATSGLSSAVQKGFEQLNQGEGDGDDSGGDSGGGDGGMIGSGSGSGGEKK
ncbi:MAG: hypothetical protein J5969_07120 [Lachnospiraceae bacterium]|nr:hypothetical protein [Lachnospiraceae bacterium]